MMGYSLTWSSTSQPARASFPRPRCARSTLAPTPISCHSLCRATMPAVGSEARPRSCLLGRAHPVSRGVRRLILTTSVLRRSLAAREGALRPSLPLRFLCRHHHRCSHHRQMRWCPWNPPTFNQPPTCGATSFKAVAASSTCTLGMATSPRSRLSLRRSHRRRSSSACSPRRRTTSTCSLTTTSTSRSGSELSTRCPRWWSYRRRLRCGNASCNRRLTAFSRRRRLASATCASCSAQTVYGRRANWCCAGTCSTRSSRHSCCNAS
mmetsp:Transcript_33040/g.77250  ORF Transcript_33040/g.77250 Transcript_33040/m.77250 type:complete len:265 (+) Transcript_33040:215-1009(+)